MKYGWVETHLHAPRADADSPLYAGILIGQVASTDDRANEAALRNAMLTYGEYQPNDGVQSLPDACFRSVATPSRLLGQPPTLAVFHADHLGLADRREAWAQAATFLVARRRVTVTMTGARVTNLHEPQQPWWDWRPAEVLLESRVSSPAAEARWRIGAPLSARLKDGAAAPLRRYRTSGETQQFQHVVFDDLVLPEETELVLDLHAWELDYDLRYGVTETIQTPYHDDMGGGTLRVSALTPGSYTFTAADWSCTLDVSVFDYPFQTTLGVAEPGSAETPGALAISPVPSSSRVSITAARGGDAPGTPALLEIADVTGRVLRRIQGTLGQAFLWDGRDSQTRPVAAGVYLARVVAVNGVRRGKVLLVR
jgi:hypothetical protein